MIYFIFMTKLKQIGSLYPCAMCAFMVKKVDVQ